MRGYAMNPKPGTGKYEQLLERCASSEPIPTAVAHPCEASALSGAVEAAGKGLISPILVGPAEKIAAVASSAGIDLGDSQIVDVEHSLASAAKAVEANADSAGLVLGARVPVILTSRADSVRSRIASCAVAMLAAHARRRNQ
jgi:phosphotransacetylase